MLSEVLTDHPTMGPDVENPIAWNRSDFRTTLATADPLDHGRAADAAIAADAHEGAFAFEVPAVGR